jgi:hypothetical protein
VSEREREREREREGGERERERESLAYLKSLSIAFCRHKGAQ